MALPSRPGDGAGACYTFIILGLPLLFLRRSRFLSAFLNLHRAIAMLALFYVAGALFVVLSLHGADSVLLPRAWSTLLHILGYPLQYLRLYQACTNQLVWESVITEKLY